MSLYPLLTAALPATSGIPRPRWVGSLTDAGTPADACQGGITKKSLTPPPLAPSSFQRTSSNDTPDTFSISVPPQEVRYGSDVG
jgi:hypothetical protein